MTEVRGIFKRPLVGIIMGLSVLGLLAALAVTNRTRVEGWFTGSGKDAESKQRALALQTEVSAMMDRVATIEGEIKMEVLDAESNMNRLEALLRSPRNLDEKTELGSKLAMEEDRWENLREQIELFDRWGIRGPAIENARTELANAKLAMREHRYKDQTKTLSAVRTAMLQLFELRGIIEKMQQSRQDYREAKQEVDILATTHRVAELPGSSELIVLIEDAKQAVEHGEFEKSASNFQSATRRVTEMKRMVLATAIERAKRATAEAIKAGDPVRAREALDRVKALSLEQQQLGAANP